MEERFISIFAPSHVTTVLSQLLARAEPGDGCMAANAAAHPLIGEASPRESRGGLQGPRLWTELLSLSCSRSSVSADTKQMAGVGRAAAF